MNGTRATRLVRVADLQAFREAITALACDGTPLDARDRLVLVPTHAAGSHLMRTIEDRRLKSSCALVLPDVITSRELVERLASRLENCHRLLSAAEREVLLSVACREAKEDGAEPPFRLRAGLIAEILRFYDTLRRNQKNIDTFERLALGALEPGSSYDRGAERLVRQTRFLAAAFRRFERRCAEEGVDEHELRRLLLAERSQMPYRHIVVTVADRAFDEHGLHGADWDLLSRIPGLERLDVVMTDRRVAGAMHERIHLLLPGIEEVRFSGQCDGPCVPNLLISAAGTVVRTSRDREEEIADFARRVKHSFRHGEITSLERVALVVHQPLPYVYLTRDVLRAAGMPSQMFDALPLAAEPYAAALDLVFSCVAANFARGPSIALLGSPHFGFRDGDRRLSQRDVGALDRKLSESAYLGDAAALAGLLDEWRSELHASARLTAARCAGEILMKVVRHLEPLRSRMSMARHLERLQDFLVAHDASAIAESLDELSESLRVRHMRARRAILGLLSTLRSAYARFEDSPVDFEEMTTVVRRWIGAHTFAPRSGNGGVHLVDDRSAPYGDFEYVQLAGLVDGEWPEAPGRNIFFSTGILRQLGWSSDADRLHGVRAAFEDLVRLPSAQLAASTFLLESDSQVSRSPLVDELEHAGLDRVNDSTEGTRVFSYEALGRDPVDLTWIGDEPKAWAALRLAARSRDDRRFSGQTTPYRCSAFSVSALERYQDCPFKFFASEILALEEPPEDEHSLSPRARGRFIHEVFQRFFEAWDERGRGAISIDVLDEARDLFSSIAESLLSRLPGPDAALERTRLFGSAISVGIVDVVLGLEARRSGDVQQRWLEYRLDGEFSLGGRRRVALTGIADRIDLLGGRRLRVIDYKTGSAPNPRRALQVAVYALCACERLSERDGLPWEIEDAAYIAFSGRRSVVPIVTPGRIDAKEAFESARARLFDVVDGVERGDFSVRPFDPMICRYCSFSSVCRKDYADDE